MRTLLLSAASAERPALHTLVDVLDEELRGAGETVRRFDLAAMPLAYCQGEFDCWVKTPGVCRAHDAEADIVRAFHDADRVVMLDAVTFGGHSYTMKRAQDRLICLISPFFEKRASLTHHEARYAAMPSLFKLGWMPQLDPDAARTWHQLADANALNLMAPHFGATVVDNAGRSQWREAIRSLLASVAVPGASIAARDVLRKALMAAAAPSRVPPMPPRTASVVIGSAKAKGTSLSEHLAHALRVRFEALGVTTSVKAATDFLREERCRRTAHEVAGADLFVLVTPLYVDAFPALATHALESIAAIRSGASVPAMFSVLVNCGFPEPEHIRTALTIARHFAAAADYRWAGGLPLGGGGAVNPRAPLDVQRGPAEHVRAALDLAAPRLARGETIPSEAIERMATSPMPDAIYRLVGDLGWRYQAFKNGVTQAALHARPLD